MIEFSQKGEWGEIVSGPGTSMSNGQKTEHGVLGERGGPESRKGKAGQIHRGSITGSAEQRAKGQGECPGPRPQDASTHSLAWNPPVLQS